MKVLQTDFNAFNRQHHLIIDTHTNVNSTPGTLTPPSSHTHRTHCRHHQVYTDHTITRSHHHLITPSPDHTITQSPSPDHTITQSPSPITPSSDHTITRSHHHPITPSPITPSPITPSPNHHHQITPSPNHTITRSHNHQITQSPEAHLSLHIPHCSEHLLIHNIVQLILEDQEATEAHKLLSLVHFINLSWGGDMIEEERDGNGEKGWEWGRGK